MADHPDTGAPLSQLAETLLRAPRSLPPGERELIAAYVSELNRTPFCSRSHSAFAAAQLAGGAGLVAEVLADPDRADITPRLRALLRIAAEVREEARPVSDHALTTARNEGAGDDEIHDTVLIAAAFCMYNRYVNCLATALPTRPDHYDVAARLIVSRGYTAPR
ncbi:carboxymuconolactone decarboxylase family protein [Streptomyces sp. NPDC056061]|uniref:carboxymuconolactone decarboxylase family protein n=1 Tax=Streptomyces sp. NPDC056061 TaxID=3345700 RepID=UPI0035DC0294